MAEIDWLAKQFEQQRGRLRAVAYRMLGSASEADDAVQEAWLKLSRAGAAGVDNLAGFLTTVVARTCLDMLRARKARPEPPPETNVDAGPEQERLLADSVGLALLVVLDALDPAERVAFVLHDLFAVPFDEIAPIVGRSAEAARQLASRARRRVQGSAEPPGEELARQRKVVDAFLAAMRAGDVEALLAVLAPGAVVRTDGAREVSATREWASATIAAARGAAAARPALVDGEAGVIVAPGGKLFRALRFALAGEKIARIDVVADPKLLHALQLSVLP